MVAVLTTQPDLRESVGRLARAPVSCAEFQWQAAGVIARQVPFDALCWHLVDPITWLPSWVVANNPVLGVQQRRLHQFCHTTDEQPALFSTGVSVLSTTTGGDLASSERWRALSGPGGMGDELTALLAADGTCWGMLHLYRERDRHFFGPAEAATIATLGPTLARRLRHSMVVPAGTHRSADGPGTLILDRNLDLVATTATAQRWLARLPPSAPQGPEPLPGFIYALATRAELANRRQPVVIGKASSRVRIRAADGTWLAVHAHRLSDSPQLGQGAIAVTIEAASAPELRPLLMRAYRLSRREREVAALVATGLPTVDIAAALFISGNTVTDHLKSIYSKAGVNSRRQLIDALSGTPASNTSGDP